ncbi:hypothetical protein B9Z55_005370 [Caenorhabditis nigoni]|uniref:Uncharacterized protein n=1 Tax=Caenorhabditis nigoni TaxID=1611254 RepID=A0A2G5V1D5_9PELO|nr:hypothetical protein B9Z55_005370 [Caenorhabditis nigoni]
MRKIFGSKKYQFKNCFYIVLEQIRTVSEGFPIRNWDLKNHLTIFAIFETLFDFMKKYRVPLDGILRNFILLDSSYPFFDVFVIL